MHKYSSPDTNVPDQLSFPVSWFCACMTGTSIQPTFPFSRLPSVDPGPAEHLQLCVCLECTFHWSDPQGFLRPEPRSSSGALWEIFLCPGRLVCYTWLVGLKGSRLCYILFTASHMK